MHFKHVLAVETSCDDTSVAIVRNDGFVVECISANQDMAHRPFGGIVPEIASRNHTLQLLPLIEEIFQRTKFSWEQIDGLAVTARPGLIGSLLVGVVSVKTLALLKNIPFVGINHLEAHLLAPFLRDQTYSPPPNFNYPYLALAISGGHTQLYLVKEFGRYEVLGRTKDDAAGEAFDKLAKHLGLGFPGGVLIDREAQKGNVAAYHLPRTMTQDASLNFSFSGLKVAAMRLVDSLSIEERAIKLADICASFQEAVVDTLIIKLDRAVKKTKMERVILTGGVSANSRLRLVAEQWAKKNKVELVIPPLRYCTDNAAMVGLAGIERLNRGESHSQDLAPQSSSLPTDFYEASSI